MIDFELSPEFQRDVCRTSIARLPRITEGGGSCGSCGSRDTSKRDAQQLPTKQLPLSVILRHQLLHSVQLILPQQAYDALWAPRLRDIATFHYARVRMPLPALLEGDFFNRYIKAGNVLMVSRGRPGVDNFYTLTDGVLRLELDKSVYERVGIVGRPVKHGGRVHVKERYRMSRLSLAPPAPPLPLAIRVALPGLIIHVSTRAVIEVNLRLPSMLHGKKGFERIVSGLKAVLNEPVKWLFCDLDKRADYSEQAPIRQHNAEVVTAAPQLSSRRHVLVPPLDPASPVYTAATATTSATPDGSTATQRDGVRGTTTTTANNNNHTNGDDDDARQSTRAFLQQTTDDLAEWLALVALDSDRVRADDDVDPYLSRYALPAEPDQCRQDNLVHLTWTGLIPASWVMRMVVSLISHLHSDAASSDHWFALTSSAFMTKAMNNDRGYSLLVLPGQGRDRREEANPASLPTDRPAHSSNEKGSNRRRFVLWEYSGAMPLMS
ncbi:hypothetical protein KEM52_001039 [Ascosphaera acerosa]|nr:hypothetical protein KEM52_001039 [Ascosphaera acerosa]